MTLTTANGALRYPPIKTPCGRTRNSSYNASDASGNSADGEPYVLTKAICEAVKGREVYLHLPNGAGRTKLTLDYLERSLGVAGTQRNWNTLLKLIAAAAIMGSQDVAYWIIGIVVSGLSVLLAAIVWSSRST